MNAPAHTPAFDPGAPRAAIAIDAHVGQRLRLRRQLRNVSQEQLGDEVGVTFQQIQKYENGRNRISASRLYRLALVLDVPVDWFFDGLPGRPAGAEGAGAPLRLSLNTGILLRQHEAMNPVGQRAHQKIAATLAGVFPAEGSAA